MGRDASQIIIELVMSHKFEDSPGFSTESDGVWWAWCVVFSKLAKVQQLACSVESGLHFLCSKFMFRKCSQTCEKFPVFQRGMRGCLRNLSVSCVNVRRGEPDVGFLIQRRRCAVSP